MMPEKETEAMRILFARYITRLSTIGGGSENNFAFFTADIAIIAFCAQVVYEGFYTLRFFPGTERRKRSMNPKHEEHIRHSFDAYCKAVMKRTAREIYSEIKKRGEREVTFSALSAQELASLSVTDEYFKGAYAFTVLGESVGVTDCDLAEALNALPTDRREIVLMKYFFEMTDKEIAERLNMARRTVAHQRTSTLQQLKQILESEE